MKTIIALDCSFTRTGICIIKDHDIYFETASCKIGEKIFENVVHAAQSIVNQLKVIFNKYDEDYDLLLESPLPCSSMSSALYSLDTLVYNEFEDHIVTTYNPATLRSRIHGHKYDKKESVALADKYISHLSKLGYAVKSDFGCRRKIPHDCAEAFLYTHLYLHDNGHADFQFDNSEEIKRYKDRMKQLKKKEKELLNDKSSNDTQGD